MSDDNKLYSFNKATKNVHTKNRKVRLYTVENIDSDENVRVRINTSFVEHLLFILNNEFKHYMVVNSPYLTRESHQIAETLYKRLQYRTVPKFDDQKNDELRQVLENIAEQDAFTKGIEHKEFIDRLLDRGGLDWRYFPVDRAETPNRVHTAEIRHRIYFNVFGPQKYELAILLYKKLKAAKKPFLFKMGANENRPDAITWYIRPQELQLSLQVLHDIVKERPDLLENSKTSPLFGQLYHGHVGYASEPQNTNKYTNKEKKFSYSTFMCELFAESCYEILKKQNQVDYNDAAAISKITKIFRTKVQQAGFDPDNMCFNVNIMRDTRKQEANKENIRTVAKER